MIDQRKKNGNITQRRTDWLRVIFAYAPPIAAMIWMAAEIYTRQGHTETLIADKADQSELVHVRNEVDKKADRAVVDQKVENINIQLKNISDNVSDNKKSVENIEKDIKDIKETNQNIYIQLERLNGRISR